MNRRKFLKSCALVTGAIPFVSVALIGAKRHPNSLFTIEELRTWCKMNGFHYVEDHEVWRNKWNSKMITSGEKNFWIYPRWPFLHQNDPDKWYELLNYDAAEWKTLYQKFFLYDIIETTLDCQKKHGLFYSMRMCSKLPYEDNTWKDNQKRVRNIEKIYDIKQRCWLRPRFIHFPDNGNCFINGFEAV